MMRSRVRAGKDRKVFRRTLLRTKSVNVYPTSMRGGFRM